MALGWKDIRYKRKPYVPNHSKLINREGQRVTYGKRAEAIADYLEKVQWATPPHIEEQDKPRVIHEQIIIKEEPFSAKELKNVLKKMKNRKHLGQMISPWN